ncbi:hypothetical protein Scep_010814 [Stephania cephalantha]|uniref:5-amino-6-(5-phosphoribosylamino)uracil reductase n=1 Tax=Stephania cephalantha TaxID=152367 RepID=A0AAP0JVT8_9MAGN
MAIASTLALKSPILFNHSIDAQQIRRAADLADKSAGFTSPHPNFGCVIARDSNVVGEGFLYAQGAKCAELQAVEASRELGRGATAYLNMEPGDCHGDQTAVSALVRAGVSRVVVGIRHPLQHLRGKAIQALRSEGLQVDVLGENLKSKVIEDALKSCYAVNAPLLFRASSRVPFSVLKYAMTLDGKIAASSGHASWISSKQSRSRVFELRGRSDAVIVGGNTVRRDDPRLTTRHGGDTCSFATQRGAKKCFQKFLASKGVEVVEFDILNPRDVMEYCYNRGYLSILWECGGTLAAPCYIIRCHTSGANFSFMIIKTKALFDWTKKEDFPRKMVFAFVAPKIIGGERAPSPVGDLGMVEMSQALSLIDVSYEQIGPDILISGFLQPIPDLTPVIPSVDETSTIDPTVAPYDASIIFFYKTWDEYGAFSNFSPHSLRMPDDNGDYITWPSVEHYYQAHKFVGVNDPHARDCIEQIKSAKSPEESARVGRSMQRKRPDLVRPDWETVKIDVMYRALKCKFSIHPQLNAMLLSTAGSVLVEASPHDLFWGGGRDGEGLNYLGRLLMQLRSEFLGESPKSSENSYLSL